MTPRRLHRLINLAIFLFLVTLVFLFLRIPSSQTNNPSSYPSFEESKWRTLELIGNDSEIAIDTSDVDLQQWSDILKNNPNASLTGHDIVQSVNFLNNNFEVLNINKFGPLRNVKTVIVVQVHNRVQYLKYLLDSLKNAKGIEDCLLVFSSDINVVAINEMIHGIDFARVYQIFYPLNKQLFPHVYPGQDPRDCPEKVGRQAAERLQCLNYANPDKYGNYRQAQLTQIKHHWWWKMNYVFDGIIDRFSLEHAWVLLLEEDHFVAPDALHVLNLITTNKNKYCEQCEIIALGTYLKTMKKYGQDISHLGAHPWFSSKHNMGMTLQRDTWLMIKKCAELFCTWDDYNWDWSVMQISAKCLPKRFKTLFAKSPRILHIGDCGVHTHRCTATNAYVAAKRLMEEHQSLLFPSDLQVTDVSRRSLKPAKENGGWGDPRDHALCRLNTHPLNWGSNTSVLDDLFKSTVHLLPSSHPSSRPIDKGL